MVTISADFLPELASWGIASEKCHLIENWAPLAELPERPKDNQWAKSHGFSDSTNLVYSGTLGLKHNPHLFVELARHFREVANVRIVVISEGLGADYLRGKVSEEGLWNLAVLPFQQYSDLPDALASADVLLAILEPEASKFSVPSKVLTYHCAGRPILASMPSSNLAATILSGIRPA